jgi:acetoacetate decarboxylase
MDLDQNIIIPQLRFRHFTKPQDALFLVSIDDECLHDVFFVLFLGKNLIVPHVDGTPRICELVEYELTDVNLKGAWTGPTALTLSSHALAPLAELPVLEIVSGMHIIADLTLPLGKVVHDYLA